MTRYEKIGYAVYLLQRYYCVLYGLKDYVHAIYAHDMRKLRRSLIEFYSGDFRDELVDFSDSELDDFIEFLQGKISRIK